MKGGWQRPMLMAVRQPFFAENLGVLILVSL